MEMIQSILETVINAFNLLKWWTIPVAAILAATFDVIFLSKDRHF